MQNYKSEKNKKKALEKLKIGRERNKKRNLEKRKNYLNNPKLCKECKSPISYEKRKNTFCSMSCSASFNNVNKPKKISKIKRYCRYCGEPIYKKNNVFCNNICSSKNLTKERDFEKMKNFILGKLND